MKETIRQFLQRMVTEQKAWIASCGGTLAGYVEKYATEDEPHRGAAIYRADQQALTRFEQRLSRL
jgi:hypothetical protein